ncbi:MAG: D-aminoacyl-tRNA deacylase, partial [Wenzhouxiangellaceae bacterium]
MIGLIQRVERARVMIDEQSCATISRGILVLVGFVRDDCRDHLPRFIERLLNYRLFGDQRGRMNLSLRDVDGELLLVPQFTLAADTHSGNRPSFTPAASPDRGEALFDELCAVADASWPRSCFGRFGADMRVELVNDGPVTFWIEVPAG